MRLLASACAVLLLATAAYAQRYEADELFKDGELAPSRDFEFTAHRTWIHLNGYSVHFSAADANDWLYGVGITHYRRTEGRVIPAWEIDVFDDSARNLSAFVGHSWTVPTKYLSVGVTGAIMYHQNFEAQNDLRILPVAFPFLETRGSRFKVRMYYVAPVRSRKDHQVAFQVMVALFR